MNKIKIITSEKEHDEALQALEKLMDKENKKELDYFIMELLVDLITNYEDKYYKIDVLKVNVND